MITKLVVHELRLNAFLIRHIARKHKHVGDTVILFVGVVGSVNKLRGRSNPKPFVVVYRFTRKTLVQILLYDSVERLLTPDIGNMPADDLVSLFVENPAVGIVGYLVDVFSVDQGDEVLRIVNDESVFAVRICKQDLSPELNSATFSNNVISFCTICQ